MLQSDFLDELEVEHAFGAFLTRLRSQARGKKIKQKDIVARLPGWTLSSYSRLESGELAPHFDQLRALYEAFRQAGIAFSPEARQQFVDLARKRITVQKTHKDIHTDAEWAQLRFGLACMDGIPDGAASRSSFVSRPPLAETSHLVGREAWRQELTAFLSGLSHKKLIVVRGPAGIGKSSELSWLATSLFYQKSPLYRVILCDFRSAEHIRGPEEALDVLLGTVLTELGWTLPQASPPSLEEQTAALLAQLEQAELPVVLLLDHAECLLHEQGLLAPCWERFLSKFLRSQHHSAIVLATQQWPGWYGGEHVFTTELPLPPLSQEKAVLLLQQLGLEIVPVPLLEEVYDKVGGIPLCLEWVAALVKQPLHADDWEEFDSREPYRPALTSTKAHDMAQAVQHLLTEPHVFGGSLGSVIAPVLDSIIARQCLSAEARQLLRVLALAPVPLAKPALAVLCPAGPRPLDELRRASLLVAYPNRAQLLPMVASAVLRHLTDEQVRESEHHLIRAYSAWVQEGFLHEREKGAVIAELAVLLLKHHRLPEAAQLLIHYGWLAFNLGHAPRLARLAREVVQQCDWRATIDGECGGVLLHYLLAPFLGETIDARQRVADYQRIQDAISSGKVELQPLAEAHVVHHLMVHTMNESHFEEAQALLDACCDRLEPLHEADLDLQASLLERRGWLLGTWCESAEEQGEKETAQALRQQAIAVYRQCNQLLSASDERAPLQGAVLKKRLARSLNNLGYHFNRSGQYEEALQAVEQSIALKEQGFVQPGALATSYGEKSQILAALGRFQEALRFDEKALEEVERCADAGYSLAQEDVWMYRVNRGRLYLRLGRVDEAEGLLREALPHLETRRRMYHMFAKDALEEIQRWRVAATSSRHQLDWRWVERYRQLASFDSYWWLAPAGLFSREEQQQWDQLFAPGLDEATKERLGTLLAQSRERELAATISEEREPQLWYPAIDIEEVHARIVGLLELQAEIGEHEPNAIVRRLYLGTIEEEVYFLRLIEATHEGDSKHFCEYNLRLNPVPTPQEMDYALSCVRRVLLQGLLRPETVEISQQVIQLLREQLQVSLDLSYSEEEAQELQQDSQPSTSDPQRMISPQTAKRFFEAVLRESSYEGWQVIIDPNASGPRIEQGLRHVFLQDSPISVNRVIHYFSHELAGHVARCVAGERSLLGLLGIHTKDSLETEEGLAIYFDRQTDALLGQVSNDWAAWIGTLATGLASGVATPPQTFLSLFTFFEPLLFLRRLLEGADRDRQAAQEKARKSALARCLRTYRGVPDLTRVGVYYSKDALYLRGLWKIECAVAEDERVLDRLSVGVVALEQLPDLQELGMVASPYSLRQRAQDPDLESYILSFEKPE